MSMGNQQVSPFTTKQRLALQFLGVSCPNCGKIISVVCEPGQNQKILKDLSRIECNICGERIVIRMYGGQKIFKGG
jgi:ribosomal protein S27E